MEKLLEFILVNLCGKQFLVQQQLVLSLLHFHYGMLIMTIILHFQIIVNIHLVDGVLQTLNNMWEIQQYVV